MPPRQARRRKPKAEPEEVPLGRPGSSSPPPSKPLVELTEEDLRAAGVTFTDSLPIGNDGRPLSFKIGPDGKPVLPPGARLEEVDSDEDDAVAENGEYIEVDEDDNALAAFWDEFFDAMLYTVPLSLLFLMLDIMTNMTYHSMPGVPYFVKRYLGSLPTIGIIIFYSNRHMLTSKLCQFIFTVASTISGMRLIWLVNKASYIKVIAQGPPIATMWILTIVQLPLLCALFALLIVGVWVWWKGMKIEL